MTFTQLVEKHIPVNILRKKFQAFKLFRVKVIRVNIHPTKLFFTNFERCYYVSSDVIEV